MFERSSLLLAAVLGLFLAGPMRAANKPDKAGAQAQEAVEAYLKALRAEDVDAVMKVAGAPFVANDKGTIATEADLRNLFVHLFDKKDMGKLRWEVKAVGTLDEVKGKLGEEKHAGLLKAILKEGDRVVRVDADFPTRKEAMAFAVTFRGGKALVVGMFD